MTIEAERMQVALELHDLGVALYRQRMRREHPDATETELDDLVRAWLAAPPPAGAVRFRSTPAGR